MAEAHVPGLFSAAFLRPSDNSWIRNQRAGSEPVAIGETGISGSSFTHYTANMVPELRCIFTPPLNFSKSNYGKQNESELLYFEMSISLSVKCIDCLLFSFSVSCVFYSPSYVVLFTHTVYLKRKE